MKYDGSIPPPPPHSAGVAGPVPVYTLKAELDRGWLISIPILVVGERFDKLVCRAKEISDIGGASSADAETEGGPADVGLVSMLKAEGLLGDGEMGLALPGLPW